MLDTTLVPILNDINYNLNLIYTRQCNDTNKADVYASLNASLVQIKDLSYKSSSSRVKVLVAQIWMMLLASRLYAGNGGNSGIQGDIRKIFLEERFFLDYVDPRGATLFFRLIVIGNFSNLELLIHSLHAQGKLNDIVRYKKIRTKNNIFQHIEFLLEKNYLHLLSIRNTEPEKLKKKSMLSKFEGYLHLQKMVVKVLSELDVTHGFLVDIIKYENFLYQLKSEYIYKNKQKKQKVAENLDWVAKLDNNADVNQLMQELLDTTPTMIFSSVVEKPAILPDRMDSPILSRSPSPFS